MVDESSKSDVLARGITVLLIAQLQASGAVPPRNDSKPLDVLLVEAGYSQTDVGALLGRSQQAVSESVKKHGAPTRKAAR